MLTRTHMVQDNVTRTLHRIERPVDVSPYIAQLLADREALARDLTGPCRDPEWRQDRIDALAFTNKELCRLGAVPAGWDSVDTSVDA